MKHGLRFASFTLGCFVTLAQTATVIGHEDAEPASSVADSTTVTFNQHIAPIIHEKCSSCHRPGQAGPFPLLNYQDVSKHALTMEAVLEDNYMPPWKPVNKNIAFANDRSLSPSQKSLFSQWIAAGKPLGPGNEPKPPQFADSWSLGPPDLIVKMNGQFEVPASGPDVYRSFVFPLRLDEDKWIKAIDYRPAAKQSVHHALFFSDPSGSARELDGRDGKPGIEGMGFLAASSGRSNAGQNGSGFNLFRRRAQPDIAARLSRGLGGYTPGNTPAKLPGDLAYNLPKGSDIVMQTHFHPSGKAEVEQGEIALYFTDKKPSRTMIPLQIPAMFGIAKGIRVPAGVTDYRVTDSYRVPIDVELISIGAHAHYICREVSMTAQLPDGSEQVLLEIDDWDLDWQDRYYFDERIVLPTGTTLTTELVYDNSADNPENPNVPPVEIRWGRESGDEMGSASVQVVAVNERELPELLQSLQDYFVAAFSETDIVDLLMQLDTNRDGGLQKSEAPAGMSSRFRLFDRNRNEMLEPEELAVLRLFTPKNKER